MFVFEKEQIIHSVGGIKVGGTPGENPTVLVGTIFYRGHKIVQDGKKGSFDSKTAENLIQAQDSMSDITGNPAMIQICSESSKAMPKYIDFVTSHSNVPILLDSTVPDVRISALRYCEEVGLLDRAIYNSVNMSATNDEIEALREIQHECAIILAFNPHDPSIMGKRAILEEGIPDFEIGLLPLSKELGITKPLIDTATTAIGSGAGSAAAFTFVSKSVYGQPTGSGVHNAPSSWTWLKEQTTNNKGVFHYCDIASNLIPQTLGADFILYGPIKNADKVFPVVAMADIFAAETLILEFGVEPVENHPFKKLL